MFDAAFWIYASSIAVLLALSGFFSGSETALTAVSRARLKLMSERGSRGASVALKITEDNERLIGSVLLGNNLVNILATSLATALLARSLGAHAVPVATLVMTFLILVFSEVLPKTYAITNAEKTASRVAGVIRIVIVLFTPFVTLVRLLVRLVLRIFGVRIDSNLQMPSVHEEISGVVSLGHSQGLLESSLKDRILGTLELSDRTVEEVLVHRSQMLALNIASDFHTLLTAVCESPFSRLPIYEGDPHNIVGVLHTRDVLAVCRDLVASDGNKNEVDGIRELIKPAYFVPESTSLETQLREFLKRHQHMAMVVDERGALQGIVTLEDILEEIVGEITDEYDESPGTQITPLGDGGFEVLGETNIRDFVRHSGWSLSDEYSNTVGGLVMEIAQSIPCEGQSFVHGGYQFKVVAMDTLRIEAVRIWRAQ